jgi:DNA polymerase III epsilon subunit-like protein
MNNLKIDRRKHYMVVLDTETAPIDPTMKGVAYSNQLVYDIGWCVVDKKGNVYKTRSFVVDEIFFGEPCKMRSSYFAKKIPTYYQELSENKRVAMSFENIRNILLSDMLEYNTNDIYAHNANFDYYALNNTYKWITKGEKYFYFPYKTRIFDIFAMSRQVIKNRSSYGYFCEKNNYITKNNQYQLKAEIIYRYISNDNNFIESHTGLEDTLIEKEILKYLFRQHKAMNGLIKACRDR